MIPSRAFRRSVQAGSFVPFENWHIEPVRSNTSMMSSGLTEHGEQAVARAFTFRESMPTIFAKTVLTLDVVSTLMALTSPFAGVQPVTMAVTHFVWTSTVALSFDRKVFRFAGSGP